MSVIRYLLLQHACYITVVRELTLTVGADMSVIRYLLLQHACYITVVRELTLTVGRCRRLTRCTVSETVASPLVSWRDAAVFDCFQFSANIWKRTGLSLRTKIRLYNTLVISVLLYGSETWTLLKADERRLEAFHMNCQRRILGIRWFHFVMNASVTSQTGEEGLAIRICRWRLSIFGHCGDYRKRHQPTPHYAWLWMLAQVVNRTSGRSGSVSEDDPAERGCSRSRTTLGSTPMTPGGLHMSATTRGQSSVPLTD